jgi:hypothetical protein
MMNIPEHAKPERPREPIDLARDELARRVEADFPGVTVTHGVFGWRAQDPSGTDLCRAQSEPGLRALLPFSGI